MPCSSQKGLHVSQKVKRQSMAIWDGPPPLVAYFTNANSPGSQMPAQGRFVSTHPFPCVLGTLTDPNLIRDMYRYFAIFQGQGVFNRLHMGCKKPVPLACIVWTKAPDGRLCCQFSAARLLGGSPSFSALPCQAVRLPGKNIPDVAPNLGWPLLACCLRKSIGCRTRISNTLLRKTAFWTPVG